MKEELKRNIIEMIQLLSEKDTILLGIQLFKKVVPTELYEQVRYTDLNWIEIRLPHYSILKDIFNEIRHDTYTLNQIHIGDYKDGSFIDIFPLNLKE